MEEGMQMKVVLLLWLWWNERNAVREGEPRRSMSDLAYCNRVFRAAQESRSCISESLQRWCKPPIEWIKVNSDGAFSATTGDGGWGYVIRDEAGAVVLAGAGRLRHIRDALHAEVLACIRGAMAAIELGVTKLVLETDSLILKQALANDSYRLTEVGGLILELKNMNVGNFSSFRCSYVPRNCNKVAHALAAEGSMFPEGGDFRWEPLLSLYMTLWPATLLRLCVNGSSFPCKKRRRK